MLVPIDVSIPLYRRMKKRGIDIEKHVLNNLKWNFPSPRKYYVVDPGFDRRNKRVDIEEIQVGDLELIIGYLSSGNGHLYTINGQLWGTSLKERTLFDKIKEDIKTTRPLTRRN